jgi:hypothetical protein
MFANSQMMGIDIGFPDVCLTPPVGVPIPYPNIALGPMGLGFDPTVLWMCMPAHNMATTIPLSNGDNPGLMLGVASGLVMGPARHLTAAFTVLVGGLPATRMTSVALQNSTNCPGMRLVPSQIKVILLAP